MTTWGYAAGFVDADGAITFDRWRQRAQSEQKLLVPMLIVTQTLDAPLVALRDLFGVGVLHGGRLELRGARRCEPVLRRLLAELIVKRRNAEIVLEFIECRRNGSRRALYDQHCLDLDAEMRTLRRKGAVAK
jgi:hypothetical protein